MSFIDDRVVKMQFDNEKFESGVDTSIKSIDRLKESLEFSDSVKHLDKLEAAGRSFSLDGVGFAVDAIGRKFSNLEIVGITALMNITNRAVDAGIRLLKSFSVDQIAKGWNTYAEKTSAVQTIMAATAKDYESIEEQTESVNKQMELLSRFTDETSYDLLTMTANVGKFTANNVRLEAAVSAMQGIANWAAISGANAEQASRAMMNLSQALGAGAVTVQDWASIESANMATAEVKQQIIDMAVEAGNLQKTTDGVYKTTRNTIVTVENFRSTLSEKWFTSDVLIDVLDKYGMAVEKVLELSDIIDKTASTTMDYVDEYNAGTLDIAALAEKTGAEIEDLTKRFEELSTEEMKFSMKTFRAGQEAKTFQEAIESVRKAADSSWGSIFEKIFGSYNEAKRVWTDLANYLYDAFITPLDTLEDILDIWNESFGKKLFMDALYELGPAAERLISPMRDVFEEVFGVHTSQEIADSLSVMSSKLYDFISSVDWSEEKAEEFKEILRGIVSVFDILKQVIDAVSPVLENIFAIAFDKAWSISLAIARWITGFDESAKESDLFNEAVNRIADAFQNVKQFVEETVEKLKDFGSRLKERYESSNIDALVEKFRNLAHSTQIINDVFEIISDTLGTILNFAVEVGKKIAGAFKNIFSEMDFELNPGNLMDGIIRMLAILQTVDIVRISSDFALGFTRIGDAIRAGAWYLEADSLQEFAKAIAILVASLFALALIPSDKIWEGVAAIGALFFILNKAFLSMYGMEAAWGNGFGAVISQSLAGISESFNFARIATALKSLATSILILAAAMWVISTIDIEDLLISLGALLVMMEMLTKSMAGFANGKFGLSIGPALISIGLAMIMLAASLKIFASMNLAELSVGLIGFMVALKTVTTSLSSLAQTGWTGAGPILVVSIAMIALGAALKIFASMNLTELSVGLIGFIVALKAVTSSLSMLAQTGWTGAGPILMVSVAMIALGAALKIFASIGWGELARGLIGFVVSLGAVVGALALLGSVHGSLLKSSAALLVASVAMIALGAAVRVFAGMDWSQLTTGLIGLGVALFSLIVFGTAATGIVAGLLALGGSMLMIATASVIGGAGLILIGAGLTALGAAIISLSTSFLVAKEMIKGILPLIVEIVLSFVTAVIEAIASSGASLFRAFSTLMNAAIDAILSVIPKIVSLGAELLVALLSGIESKIGEIVILAGLIVIKLIEAFATLLPALIQALASLVIAVINGIADAIRRNADAMFNAIGNLISAIIELVLTGIQRLLRLFGEPGEALANQIEGWKGNIREALYDPDMVDAGKDYLAEFEQGVKDSFASLGVTTQNGALDIVGGIKTVFAPQTGFEMGYNFADGIVRGADLSNVDWSNVASNSEAFVAEFNELIAGSFDSSDISETITTAVTPTGGVEAGFEFISDIQNGMLTAIPDGSQAAGAAIASNVATGITDTSPFVTSAAEGTAGAAVDGFNNSSGDFYNAGVMSATGYAEGMLDTLGLVDFAGVALGTTSVDAARAALGIHSPSKEFGKLAEYSVAGYANGLEDMAKTPVAVLLNAVKKLKEEYEKAGVQIGETEMYEKASDAVQNLAEYLFDLQEATNKSGTATEKTLENMQAAWADFRNNLSDVLKDCTNMFTEFSFESTSSVEALMTNLTSKTNAMQAFGALMMKAASMGLDPKAYEEFLQKGPTADVLAQLQTMVDGGVLAVRKFNEAYTKNAETAEDLKDTLMAGYATALAGGLDASGMNELIAQGLESILDNTEFKKLYQEKFPELFEIGAMFAEAISMGVLDGTSEEAMFIEAFLKELQNDISWAPEHAYENGDDYAGSFEEGFINSGIGRMQEALESALSDLQTYADADPIEIVVDTSDAETAIDRIRNALNDTKVAIDSGALRQNVDGIVERPAVEQNKAEEKPTINNYSYHQTVNSPHPLREIDIARDTQRILRNSIGSRSKSAPNQYYGLSSIAHKM